MNVSLRPNSRVSELIVQRAEDDLLVYDIKAHRALNLNETAAKVWQSLDGQKTLLEIADVIALPVEAVLLSVDELQKKNLLAERVETGIERDKVTRRKMLARVAATAVALPLIVSIVAPTAAFAQSACVRPLGQPPGYMDVVTTAGTCAATNCSSVCGGFNLICCSDMFVSAGTCTDLAGPPQQAVCDCVCA